MTFIRSFFLCALFSVSLTLIASQSASADWREFRGPSGQGHADQNGLPTKWSPTENVIWKESIPGVGWSSPIVVGKKIFLTTAVEAEDDPSLKYSLRAICVDLDSGKILWNNEVFRETSENWQRIHKKNSHASPTPISDGEYVYVHFGTHGTACLKLNGDVVWKRGNIQYVMQHGNGGSPIIVDDKLVMICDGKAKNFVIALDRMNGKTIWKVDRLVETKKRFSFGTPLLITVNGEQQIVAPGTNMISGHRLEDGEEIWKLNYNGYSVIPRPVYEHGLIFVTTSYDKPSLLAVKPDGKGDVTETHLKWSETSAIPHTPSLLVVGDELYSISDKGIAQCFDAKTGKVHWKERIGGNFSASPLYSNGKIYLQSEEGLTTVISASKEFKKLNKNDLESPTLASFAVEGNTLLIRTKTDLYRIGKK